ncbi:hypothetical protein POM88_048818 [Heracleum sosnowskyi]|uniref:F-box domain-containing protein n=1 Tax=Heracleum sosnowskyi TaxID=360622 RepID=A0AAD8M0Z5_9APIA|nr:hypothetical protein POM88_048818 [Heracleum sosnowskyi]
MRPERAACIHRRILLTLLVHRKTIRAEKIVRDKKDMFSFNYEETKMFVLFILCYPFFIGTSQLQESQDTYFYSLPEPKDDLENKIKEHEHEDEEQVDMNLWSELDVNLLGEILSRLCLTDQARFRVVCKNWLAAHPINITKSLPWYLTFDHSRPPVTRRFEFQLYDPSSPNLALVHNIALATFGIPCSSYMEIGATLKHNWLFICTRNQRLFFWTRRYFLLFSPFTRKIITLPRFDYPCRFKYFMSTFSTEPDSPDCIFFLLGTCHADKIAVLTYRNGDKEWTAKQFNTVTDFVPCPCDLVYHRGMLYIVSPLGQLASYNIANGEFKFEHLLVNRRFVQNIISSMKHKVLVLNGELMILYFESHAEQNATLLGKQCIRRYNWLKKGWIPVSTLGDKSLFVNDKAFKFATIDKKDKINGVLPNKIYYFFDGGCLVYSIEEGELVEFKSICSDSLEDGGGDLNEYKNYFGTTFSDTNKSIYWLEPPCVRVCPFPKS